ncbi:MAG TPA: hypothetical protein VIL99_10985 [Ignavibacteria bacterium]
MSRKLTIYKIDNWNTRVSKKSLNLRIKRRHKKYTNPFKHKDKKRREHEYLKSKITYNEEIERFCSVNNISRWKESDRPIKFDESFCLFENPDSVLRTLLEMLHRAKVSQKMTRLRYAGKVSFGALYLVDNLCWEIAKKRRWNVICENISDIEREKLSKLRSMSSSSYESVNANMINERVRITRKDDPKADQSYKVKSKDITDMVQNAIRETKSDQKFELPFEAYQAINSTIGEHFDNIILHAPNAEIGILCGFYDKDAKEITVLIYNFGKTIYESFGDDSLPEQMKSVILEIIENHAKKNFFIGSRQFTPENALTLLAVQEGISSRVKFDKTRGHGLIDFIEHCFNLSTGTRVVLISGNTAVKFDNKYQVGKKWLFDRERRVIAMNEANDIYEKPDSSYVINLNINFPGVLIETTIPLKQL